MIGGAIDPLVCPRGHHSVEIGRTHFRCKTCYRNDRETYSWDRSELVDLREQAPPEDERQLVTDGGVAVEDAPIPETVVVRPDRDTVHRQGDGLEPACIDRLHNTDADWRLTQESRTDPENRCGHPECFRDEQPVTDGAVPERYQPEPREWEDKDYLYEQYWGDLKTLSKIASQCGVSRYVVASQMHAHGIPIRVRNYTRENSVSPFAGFYAGTDTPGRSDDQSRQQYDPDFEAGHESETDDDGAFRWGVVDSKGDRR